MGKTWGERGLEVNRTSAGKDMRWREHEVDMTGGEDDMGQGGHKLERAGGVEDKRWRGPEVERTEWDQRHTTGQRRQWTVDSRAPSRMARSSTVHCQL